MSRTKRITTTQTDPLGDLWQQAMLARLLLDVLRQHRRELARTIAVALANEE